MRMKAWPPIERHKRTEGDTILMWQTLIPTKDRIKADEINHFFYNTNTLGCIPTTLLPAINYLALIAKRQLLYFSFFLHTATCSPIYNLLDQHTHSYRVALSQFKGATGSRIKTYTRINFSWCKSRSWGLICGFFFYSSDILPPPTPLLHKDFKASKHYTSFHRRSSPL